MPESRWKQSARYAEGGARRRIDARRHHGAVKAEKKRQLRPLLRHRGAQPPPRETG